jgi:hypothetical protein
MRLGRTHLARRKAPLLADEAAWLADRYGRLPAVGYSRHQLALPIVGDLHRNESSLKRERIDAVDNDMNRAILRRRRFDRQPLLRGDDRQRHRNDGQPCSWRQGEEALSQWSRPERPENTGELPDLPGLDFSIELLGVKHDRFAKNRGGRPPKLRPDADTLKTLRGLGRINATHVECARMLDVSRETFEKFLGREKKAREAFERGKALWRIELRRLQFKSAMAGNVAMLIWLGKQYLGQKDKIEQGFTYRTQTISGDAKGETAKENLRKPGKARVCLTNDEIKF